MLIYDYIMCVKTGAYCKALCNKSKKMYTVIVGTYVIPNYSNITSTLTFILLFAKISNMKTDIIFYSSR